MLASTNPFSPGSGLRPPALAGRSAQLSALDTIIARAQNNRPSRGLVLSGLRGVGKTVLLNEMRSMAERSRWFSVSLEARGDDAGSNSMRRILARDIAVTARGLNRRRALSDRMRQALSSVAAFNVKAGVTGIELGVEISSGRADSGDIEVDLPELVQDLAAALAEEKQAFVLFIDEMQDLDEELLRALLVTQHQAGQRGWPFFIVGAGLPHLSGLLADIRSYAERLFDYQTVDRLPTTEASQAVEEPLRMQHIEIERAALDILLDVSGGYPYFLQEYGRAAWEVSPGSPITAADAEASVALGLQRLDAGFFASRWRRATRSERRMLVAMAEDHDGPSQSSEVARRMSLRPTSLGPYRASLISKGLIYAPEHGQLAYTVPKMADYVHRRREDLD